MLFRSGYSIWNESFGQTAEQFAFDRVNSFIAGGFAAELDEDLLNELSPELVGKVNKARIETPSKTLAATKTLNTAVKKAWVKSQVGVVKEKTEEPTGKLKDACWSGYTAVGMKMKNGRKVPNCVPVKEAVTFKTPHEKSKHFKTSETAELQSVDPNDPDSRFDGTTSATNVYKRSTPGQSMKESTYNTIRKTISEATYKGRKVSLNKPFRTPGGPKKSAVYVDPDGDGKAKIVRFGDPNLSKIGRAHV